MKNILPKQAPCWRRWNRKGWSAFASLHRAVTIGVLSAGMSILLLATQSASAQPADTAAVLRELRIREVGVSGSLAAPLRNVQSQTPLFDRKAQAAAPYQTLEAALRTAPSVDLRERGGKGTQADISIRGGSFDQTMILLNGIDFTDARTGHQSHSLPVDLDCISGVDLLEGIPGVGAYAGAVNIRTAPLLPRYLRFEGAGGQYGYAYANLSGAVTAGHFSVLGAASYRRSDGYRHNTDFALRARFRGSGSSTCRPVIRTVLSGRTASMPPITPSSGSIPPRRWLRCGGSGRPGVSRWAPPSAIARTSTATTGPAAPP